MVPLRPPKETRFPRGPSVREVVRIPFSAALGHIAFSLASARTPPPVGKKKLFFFSPSKVENLPCTRPLLSKIL